MQNVKIELDWGQTQVKTHFIVVHKPADELTAELYQSLGEALAKYDLFPEMSESQSTEIKESNEIIAQSLKDLGTVKFEIDYTQYNQSRGRVTVFDLTEEPKEQEVQEVPEEPKVPKESEPPIKMDSSDPVPNTIPNFSIEEIEDSLSFEEIDEDFAEEFDEYGSANEGELPLPLDEIEEEVNSISELSEIPDMDEIGEFSNLNIDVYDYLGLCVVPINGRIEYMEWNPYTLIVNYAELIAHPNYLRFWVHYQRTNTYDKSDDRAYFCIEDGKNINYVDLGPIDKVNQTVIKSLDMEFIPYKNSELIDFNLKFIVGSWGNLYRQKHYEQAVRDRDRGCPPKVMPDEPGEKPLNVNNSLMIQWLWGQTKIFEVLQKECETKIVVWDNEHNEYNSTNRYFEVPFNTVNRDKIIEFYTKQEHLELHVILNDLFKRIG